ncbi:Domain of unknown function DUF1330 [Comamonadaceae bacterium]
MPTIDPSRESFSQLFAKTAPDEPVTMLNLLRFKAQAEYAADRQETPCSGREAYSRYAAHALKSVQAAGGIVVWQGRACHALVAPTSEAWDDVLLVKYPNAAAFMNMVRSPAYQAFVHHRSAALADARLIAMQQ